MENADKKNSAIRLLVALDENYLPQLQVLLTSISINSPQDVGALYLMHSGISAESLQRVEKQCSAFGCALHPVPVSADFFQEAPVTKRYPQEMYYRLLAPHLLPEDLDRILYLDPDILVINSLRPLWETDLKGCLFAAASHTGLTEIANDVNRIRLGTDSDYYNSGVLLMDLNACRKEIVPEEVFAFSAGHRVSLLLPDQDILNGLYGTRILGVDDSVWNYDARRYDRYWLGSHGEKDMDWVMDHTVFLHFCGKNKPWSRGYEGHFSALYKHYQRLLGEV